MDAGDVLAIESIPVPDEMTFGELEKELCDLSVQLLFQVIHQFEKGEVKRTPQDHTLATLAPKLTPEEEKIDWTKTSEAIHDQIRAFSPFPGAWCTIKIGPETKRLKIKRSKVEEGKSGQPGAILTFGKEGWIVACGQGALRLLEVQLEGKKAMSAEECIRGIHQPVSLIPNQNSH